MEDRCVVILNENLPSGKAANAAAVIALTLGQRHPHFVGTSLQDANNQAFPGLITTGIPVLAATDAQFSQLCQQCAEKQHDVILFPEEGQQTTDYAAFSAAVHETPVAHWRLLGMAVVAEKKTLRKLTAQLKLFV